MSEVVGQSPYELEFILVDNGSTDTHLILKDRNIRLLLHTLESQLLWSWYFGRACHSASDILGWTHADRQTDPGDVLKAMPYFGKDSEQVFVKGRRFCQLQMWPSQFA